MVGDFLVVSFFSRGTEPLLSLPPLPIPPKFSAAAMFALTSDGVSLFWSHATNTYPPLVPSHPRFFSFFPDPSGMILPRFPGLSLPLSASLTSPSLVSMVD